MKTAFVTGGSRGIGSAIALALGKTFHVVVGFANSEDKANDVVKEIVAAGGSASTVQIDISNAESVDNAFTTIEKEYNSVDVLINNAGVAIFNPIEDVTSYLWREVMATNLDSIFFLTQSLTPMLKKTRGTVVNIASISGLRASTYGSHMEPQRLL